MARGSLVGNAAGLLKSPNGGQYQGRLAKSDAAHAKVGQSLEQSSLILCQCEFANVSVDAVD